MPQSDNRLDVDSSFVITGDFNHDSLLNVASLSAAPATVTILLGNGNGTFRAPVDYSVGTTLDSSGFAVGDFNGDGNLDFAVVAENAITSGIVSPARQLASARPIGDGDFFVGLELARHFP